MAEQPVLGVFLAGAPDRVRPFGPMTPFFQRLCTLAPEVGVRVVGLYPDGVRARDRIQGILWAGEHRGFVVRNVPRPDMVWERVRGGFRYHPGSPRLLRDWGIPFLNSVILNKWDGYRVLARDPVIRPYLPETLLLEGSEDALGILQRYGRAYVKPIRGAMGRGILRILRRGRRYLGEYAPGPNRPVRSVDLRGGELEEWLDRRTGEEVYLVQQGLRLEVLDGRTADIRILMQKDGRGRWQVTGMGARLGAPGRFTSNLHTGGQGVPVHWLLGRLLPGDPARQQAVEEEARNLAFRICQVLEERTGPLGELGIDIGLEPSGRLWYIEHNYYPGRSILRHLGDEAGYRLAHRRPLEYARWAVERLRRGEPLLGLPSPEAPAARGLAVAGAGPGRPSARPGRRPPVVVLSQGPADAPSRSGSRRLTPVPQAPAPPRDRKKPSEPDPASSGATAGRARVRWIGAVLPTFLRTFSGKVLRPAPSDRGRLRPAR